MPFSVSFWLARTIESELVWHNSLSLIRLVAACYWTIPGIPRRGRASARNSRLPSICSLSVARICYSSLWNILTLIGPGSIVTVAACRGPWATLFALPMNDSCLIIDDIPSPCSCFHEDQSPLFWTLLPPRRLWPIDNDTIHPSLSNPKTDYWPLPWPLESLFRLGAAAAISFFST